MNSIEMWEYIDRIKAERDIAIAFIKRVAECEWNATDVSSILDEAKELIEKIRAVGAKNALTE
jgi:hypothetical protein